MVIFHSYVSLPEGTLSFLDNLLKICLTHTFLGTQDEPKMQCNQFHHPEKSLK